MALSADAVKRIMIALASADAGNEVANAVNVGTAGSLQDTFCVSLLVVATSVSPTTNFGPLAVGDVVIHVPAVAGNAQFWTVATAGTLPAAAVVGDLYIAWRAFATPAAVATKF